MQECKHPAIAFYADADDMAPPDYARKIQASMPTSCPIYFISPGNYGHNWMGSRVSFWANLADDLYSDKTIIINGNEALLGTG
ncbi:hypothetical protein CPA45_21535 [Vreelandella nigrificans]|uniref:Peptidase S9 prolyl oligopeptidase catalytic domain-containing protein n=2 Tax=Vreelandella nigrificans TaxID=2042704 RepID=A0A2A4HGY2_9GAMM|nr:hypothetical protein CPA45_21535 [Halomonas nigrificans]